MSGNADKDARERRLAEALRRNLRRRKAPRTQDAAPPGDASGGAPEKS